MVFLRDRFVDETDETETARDGEVVRTRMLMMDARRSAFDARDHQPHYAEVSDAMLGALGSARGAWIKQINDAWRTPQRTGDMRSGDAAEPDNSSRAAVMRRHLRGDDPDDNAAARREKAWAAYKDQLSNAWRTDPRAATAIERQGERWRGGR